ncbi:Crp/Fnr family transcriptional regulator [Caulobacter sp. 17J80-11]|uniref:Crp/Fnr family transcriptional regulator n=1 Tax=Caulobacter sp. 17J80-11 TaxID=2763502 RepID=UPI001653BFE3|nr:Crp/Fnr family transcriptional regulator [Caulobacter sp. 17J80-11]MBC6981308.1 Crp/Fnr family transcriptional regulator [Caulobacter sp. 17J80-11]
MNLEPGADAPAPLAFRARPAAVERLLTRTRIRDFAEPDTVGHKGMRLVRQGAGATPLHVLLSGWAARTCTTVGEATLLDLLMPGDVFGLDAEAGVSDYAVVALTTVRVLTVPRSRWGELFNADPEFRQVYVQSLTDQASRARRRLLALNARTPAAKLCGVLLDLHERACSAAQLGDDGETSPELPLSRSLAAAAVGLTTEHVVRLAAHLRRAGVVDWGRDSVRVLAPDRLREMALARA